MPPPVSSFAIIPLRMGLVMVAGLSVLIPLGFLLAIAIVDGGLDGSIIVMIVLITGVGQALLGFTYMVNLVKPAPYLKDMRAMLLGDGTHWQYDETQWREATGIEAQRSRRALRAPIVAISAVGAVFTLIGLAATGGTVWAALVQVLTFATICGYVCLVMWATGVAAWARKAQTGEIHISRLGIYRRPGGYTPFSNAGYRLHNVILVETTPAYLRFEIVRSSLFEQRTVLAELPVPVGREEDARQLADRFRMELVARE